jgi:hypothetical protein
MMRRDHSFQADRPLMLDSWISNEDIVGISSIDMSLYFDRYVFDPKFFKVLRKVLNKQNAGIYRLGKTMIASTVKVKYCHPLLQ